MDIDMVIKKLIMKKKLLVLGNDRGSCEIVRFAKNHGIYTIVTDYYPPSRSTVKLIADEFWMISTADLDLLEEKCRIEGIDGILSGASDFNVEMSLHLCQRLGLKSYCTLDAWHFSRDKADFKKICKEVGAPVPTDYYISDKLSDEEINRVIFPVMVKPVDLAGNRGISYCYNKNDLLTAYHHAHTVSKNNKIIVERMLHGQEWNAMYAIANGEPRLAMLSTLHSQPGYPKNCLSFTTTASNHIAQFMQELNPKIEAVLKKIGATDGIAWFEVMRDADGHFYILEMGYRFDGGMLIIPYRELSDFDGMKWMVESALGIEHTIADFPKPLEKAYVKCAGIIELRVKAKGTIHEINGFDRLAELYPDIYLECIMKVGDSIEEYRPLGIITFFSDNCDEMCKMIDIVNSTISVIDENGKDILIRYTDFDYLKHIYREGLAEK